MKCKHKHVIQCACPWYLQLAFKSQKGQYIYWIYMTAYARICAFRCDCKLYNHLRAQPLSELSLHIDLLDITNLPRPMDGEKSIKMCF